jgi:hypothetical protein
MSNISVNSSLDEYIESPLSTELIFLLDKLHYKWDNASIITATVVSTLTVIALVILVWALTPNLPSREYGAFEFSFFAVLVSILIATMYLMFYPICASLLVRRYPFRLTIDDINFHQPGTRDVEDFEFCQIDPAKVAYHPKATLLLSNIKAMGRDPAVFEYRLIKKMVSL